MSPDIFWIPGPWRGRLAISLRPRGGDWLEEEVSGWRQAGIDVVISTLESHEANQLELNNESNLAAAQGIQYISFPIPDRGVPQSVTAASTLLADIARMLDQGQNVAVHCRQGIGRSGLVAAGVLTMSGAQPGEAVKTVSRARGLAVPETPDQTRWLLKLPAQSTVVSP